MVAVDVVADGGLEVAAKVEAAGVTNGTACVGNGMAGGGWLLRFAWPLGRLTDFS